MSDIRNRNEYGGKKNNAKGKRRINMLEKADEKRINESLSSLFFHELFYSMQYDSRHFLPCSSSRLRFR